MTIGYDRHFIDDQDVPLPTLGPTTIASAFSDGKVIHHTRFSLVFSHSRNFAIYTAHNIDGATLLPEGTIPRDDDFRIDPDVEEGLQVNNRRGYSGGDANPWDRGHLVRRASLHWGELTTATMADNESFFWTNIAPQHRRLHSGAWGKIENWMVDLAGTGDKKACVFTGPVFTPDDPEHSNHPDEMPIRIPAAFWKILVVKMDDKLRAAGFLVWQRDYDKVDPVTFDPHLEQVRITTLEYLFGMSFHRLRDLDPLRFPERTPGTTPRRAPSAEPPFTGEPAAARGRFVFSKMDIAL